MQKHIQIKNKRLEGEKFKISPKTQCEILLKKGKNINNEKCGDVTLLNKCMKTITLENVDTVLLVWFHLVTKSMVTW